VASQFCRACGTLLTARHKVTAPPSSALSRKREGGTVFPYSPYPQQQAFMADIRAVVGGGGVLVAEACNGFGKTVCALASLLPMGRRIVYATRTHEQVRQVLREVEAINRRAEQGFSAVNLASRLHLCLHERCRSLSAMEAAEACRLLTETGRCPYRREFEVPAALPRVLSIHGLRTQGSARRLCPYFLARRAAEACTVIVAPYQYIFHEDIRVRVNLELTGRVLVFDEAHNADQIGQDALSDTLSARAVDAARRELEAVHVASGVIDGLAAYLDRKVAEDPAPTLGATLRDDLQQVVGVATIASVVEEWADVVDEIRSAKLERGDAPVCFLNGVLRFLGLVDASPGESYVAIFRRASHGGALLEYRCLDPSLAIRPVVEAAAGALVMSGTLSPLEVFTEITGLQGAATRAYAAIADPQNVRTVIDGAVTTRFADRGAAMTRRYGQRLARWVAEVPHGVLIFFPQRRLMLECLTSWRRSGILEEAGTQSFLQGKPVFVEGAHASANRKIVDAYKTAATGTRGAVLCGVFRGRNAEGSNFPYDEARGVVLIGVPYADFSDPVVKAQIRYLNGKSRGLGERWYSMDAFRAANQAMGRGIRHRDDWCNFILMDRRYAAHQHLLSPWALGKGVHCLTT
jgi:Rad3-related DNA helicase